MSAPAHPRTLVTPITMLSSLTLLLGACQRLEENPQPPHGGMAITDGGQTAPDTHTASQSEGPGAWNLNPTLQSNRAQRVAAARGTSDGGRIDAELRARPITESSDRSLSPFFFVQNGDSGLDQLPLKASSADVDVVGVIADVLVTQVYKNEGKRPIEARYVFPASTRAAVYGMRMTIGERTITAEIQEKEQARATYEAARAAGQSASLLEQQRPNVFEMNVANIMPGDEIKVEMRYTELMIPTDGIYEFVYPTVVGPRYSNQAASAAPPQDQFVANPYTHAGEKPRYSFDFTATLSTGIPIQGVASPSHNMTVHYEGENAATVVLDASDQTRGNKDLILRYRLSGGQIETGMLLYEGTDRQGNEDHYFLMMAQPPKVVKPSYIPPREFLFIVDISGSMSGFPIATSKQLLRDLIGNLKPDELFNVLLFAGSTAVYSERSLPANPENIDQAIRLIESQRGGGGTELLPALQRALNMPRTQGYARSVVVATDGYVDVEREAYKVIRENLGDANFFTFGIGTSVNRYLLEGMAKVGMGETGIITDGSRAVEEAAKFRQYIEAPVLTQVRVKTEGFDAFDVEPRAVPDLLAQRPVLVYGRYKGKARGKLVLEGLSGEGPYRQVFELGKLQAKPEHAALRSLWARNRIATLRDYGDLEPGLNVKEAVTQLGLNYNLLTDYTSFVAVDSAVRNKTGASDSVQQPLPMPEGVSDGAVGGVLGSRGDVQEHYGRMVGFGGGGVGTTGGGPGSGGYGSATLGASAPARTREERKMAPQAVRVQEAEAAAASAPAASASASSASVDAPAPVMADKSNLQVSPKKADEFASKGKNEAGPFERVQRGKMTVVKGNLKPDELRILQARTLSLLKQRLVKAVAEDPSLRGKLTVLMTLSQDGSVKSVVASGSEGLKSAKVLLDSIPALLKSLNANTPGVSEGDVLKFELEVLP
ncbi:MAG: VIT and vWA domain-containing protein [Myxococcota bacterium]